MKMTQLRKSLENGTKAFVARRGGILTNYNRGDRPQRMRMIESVARRRPMMLNPCDAAQLVSAVLASKQIPGCMAEIGVAFGASAFLISSLCPEKRLHLFDTFTGLPELTEHDSHELFQKGTLGCPLDSVKAFLSGSHVEFHPGLFPRDTGESVASEKFSFVHLDIDLYEGTLRSLEFLYPRMSPGGIILGHDFLVSKGVTKAFREYFDQRPEPLIELIGNQCLVVKLS